ncbi:MAG: protein phosphatase 2C domain-containing protein [Kangiellaceae bacterium]|nr:protein phosphatase 2C domain-containing protein [Kangiellaceae bacterium]
MKYQFQTICDRGAVRPNNEDAIKYGVCAEGDIAWMVIADGMGGHNAGEVASGLVVDEIEQAIKRLKNPKIIETQENTKTVDWLCWIEIEINRANNKIFNQAKNNSQQTGMGTTVVIAIIDQGKCNIGWVGDSRAYHYRSNEENALTQLTQDHTMIQALLDKGAITKKEALQSNNKNLLSRAVGIKKGVDVETLSLQVKVQDIILLSTDGLHDSLEQLSLEKSIGLIEQGSEMTHALVEEAINNGSKDNITFGSILISDKGK